jgi:hypothetical protein
MRPAHIHFHTRRLKPSPWESGSHETPRWRERVSNPRFPVYRELAAPAYARDTIHGAIMSPERRFVRVDEVAVRLQHAWGALSHGQSRP